MPRGPITVDDFYRRWRAAMEDAAPRYSAGIRAVQESPMERAAQNKQRWVDGVRQAAENGRYENGLRSVTLQQWKDAAANIGAQRLRDGAVKAERKVRTFWATYGDFIQNTAASVRQLPKTTYADRRQRAIAMMDALHNNPYREFVRQGQ